jgi:hypothetical protein
MPKRWNNKPIGQGHIRIDRVELIEFLFQVQHDGAKYCRPQKCTAKDKQRAPAVNERDNHKMLLTRISSLFHIFFYLNISLQQIPLLTLEVFVVHIVH